ncbi:methyl-accepting chemotaxis protein [Corallococcus praedator]|uniref:Methyl-accepting chemotaxis protein n=1 Tax=Corallococcus praedator TaxID=2316724 RepID=A0ABX9QRS3_9BACT|nr:MULTISPECIES: methyl-accepting chemotaxis protein [Corallococcus]RKH20862.1 methyl-accepting chemotaxis protein [Corallococcus sp. CA047B]RKH35416.1 methyl-accepting chemotaxis protein [Corallococcus sp. CA031C]RKI15703.1 methyl-accepting chemotaxis protein [Corallococcus praedator]
MRLLSGLKLRGRLTLWVCLLLIAALTPVVAAGVHVIRRTVGLQIHGVLQVEAEGLRDLVESSLHEREANARAWTEDAIVRGALLFGTYAKSDAVLATLNGRHASFAGLVLFTEDGRAVSVSRPELREAFEGHERDVLASPWFQAALEDRLDPTALTRAITRTDPFFGRPVMPLALPVLSPISGARVGVLLAAYDWNQLEQVVAGALQRSRERGQRSFTLEVLGPDDGQLYSSRARNVPAPLRTVRAQAVDDTRGTGAGRHWRFVATVDEEEAFQPLRNFLKLSVLAVAALLLLAALAAWALARGVTRPITTLSGLVSRVVREGDLTQKVALHGRQDEVGELASAFARMMDHLRESTASLQQGTRVLGQTVAELTRATEQQERNLTQQTAALQETQVTAQEIQQTSQVAAERSQAVLGLVARARQAGSAGETTLGASLDGFEELRDHGVRLAEGISSLNERTQQIGGITQTVKDLADQSNMLALNAAIEAVRSGEHGKGFSVVAREIRSLADQSIQATGRVRDILDDIRGGIHATVALSEEGQRRSEAGLAQVRASGQSLRALTDIIQDNASAAQQIAAAVIQQNAGIAQIFTAVTDLSRMMDDTLEAMQGTQRMTHTLRGVAERMETVAGVWRV